ncbi:MAG: carbohydrate kinase family protein [Anaerolineaceae bacterium]|nr:carbohydrate kinase family protein [Anaerolineaceae bacterium]
METVITGSIAYDYLMRFPGRFTDHLLDGQLHHLSLSFLVEDMTRHWGGTAANIAYTAALLGLRPRLMGTVGSDFGDYRAWLESSGVDTSAVRQIDALFTASFFANTDLDNNQIASFYAGAMTCARGYRLADLEGEPPDLVFISPNDPEAMLQLAADCRQLGIAFICDPSQQVARFDGNQLRELMRGARVLVMNAYEAGMICQKTGLSQESLVNSFPIVLITRGAAGAEVHENGVQRHVAPFPVCRIADPTGAGDAFRGGFLCGLVAGWPLVLCARVGALSASFALEQTGTQSHRFSVDEFIERFRQSADDAGQLEQLYNLGEYPGQ